MKRILGIAAAAVLALAPTAFAAPSTTVVDSLSASCTPISARGLSGTTGAAVTASDVAQAYVGQANCSYANTLIRYVGRTGIERPFIRQGFNCTPSISGDVGRWTCTFRGADTATLIRIRFRARYA